MQKRSLSRPKKRLRVDTTTTQLEQIHKIEGKDITKKLHFWKKASIEFQQMCGRSISKTKQVCDANIPPGWNGLTQAFVLKNLLQGNTQVYFLDMNRKLKGFAFVTVPENSIEAELTVLCTVAPGAPIAIKLLEKITHDLLEERVFILETHSRLLAEEFYVAQGFSYDTHPCAKIGKIQYCPTGDNRHVIGDLVPLYKCLDPVSESERELVEKCTQKNIPLSLQFRFPQVQECKELRNLYLGPA